MRAPNPKQLAFVARYLATGNATRSYVEAGYAGRGRCAESAASRLLRHPAVRAAIDAATQKAMANHELTAEWVLARLRDEATRRGPGSSHAARVKALELLGRRFGLFPARHEHTGASGAPIRLNLAKLSGAQLGVLDELLATAEEPAVGDGPA